MHNANDSFVRLGILWILKRFDRDLWISLPLHNQSGPSIISGRCNAIHNCGCMFVPLLVQKTGNFTLMIFTITHCVVIKIWFSSNRSLNWVLITTKLLLNNLFLIVRFLSHNWERIFPDCKMASHPVQTVFSIKCWRREQTKCYYMHYRIIQSYY